MAVQFQLVSPPICAPKMWGRWGLWSPPPQRTTWNEKTEPSLLPRPQEEKTGSSVHEGKRLKFPLRATRWWEVSMTPGLSKAHLQEWKGLKLQVETKCTLNT